MLSTRAKNVLLSLHILLTTAWVGGLVVMLMLFYTRAGFRNGDELAVVDRTIFYIHEYVIVNVNFGFVFTGLCFSSFTRWGFVKFYWVILKWLMLFVFAAIITVLMIPAVNGMAARSDVLRGAALSDPTYLAHSARVVWITWLELIGLAGVIVVSVFKPWGARPHQADFSCRVGWGITLVLGVGLAFYVVWQNLALSALRRLPVEDIPISRVANGTYRGEANVGGFLYALNVTVLDGKIASIDVVSNRNDPYATLADGTRRKVLEAQRVQVDMVTGASTTSKAFMLAIEDALRKGVKP
jgi:uncharacterized protein with FMN-binding domain